MKTALRVLLVVLFSPVLIPAAAFCAVVGAFLALLSLLAMAFIFMVEGEWKWVWLWDMYR